MAAVEWCNDFDERRDALCAAYKAGYNADIAEKLMQIAARIAVQSPFGWSHPDCEVLEWAARILRGEPPTTSSAVVGGVLSKE